MIASPASVLAFWRAAGPEKWFKKDTAFERVRYTGRKVYTPTALHVKDTGIEITFAEPLKKESADALLAMSRAR